MQNPQQWRYAENQCIDSTASNKWIAKTLELIGLRGDCAEDDGSSIRVGHSHEYLEMVEGKFYAATNALLCQIINPLDKIIVAYEKFTAHARARGFESYHQHISELNHWSNIAYLRWLSEVDQRSDLRYAL